MAYIDEMSSPDQTAHRLMIFDSWESIRVAESTYKLNWWVSHDKSASHFCTVLISFLHSVAARLDGNLCRRIDRAQKKPQVFHLQISPLASSCRLSSFDSLGLSTNDNSLLRARDKSKGLYSPLSLSDAVSSIWTGQKGFSENNDLLIRFFIEKGKNNGKTGPSRVLRRRYLIDIKKRWALNWLPTRLREFRLTVTWFKATYI